MKSLRPKTCESLWECWLARRLSVLLLDWGGDGTHRLCDGHHRSRFTVCVWRRWWQRRAYGSNGVYTQRGYRTDRRHGGRVKDLILVSLGEEKQTKICETGHPKSCTHFSKELLCQEDFITYPPVSRLSSGLRAEQPSGPPALLMLVWERDRIITTDSVTLRENIRNACTHTDTVWAVNTLMWV